MKPKRRLNAAAAKAAAQHAFSDAAPTSTMEGDQYVSPFADGPEEQGFGFGDEASADLADLEHMLNVEVDEDFFVEPRFFHTLHRVINVLGIQLADEHKEDGEDGKSLLERNPAYQSLQKQAQVVENAIEHMSRVYCNALNRSVIQVGRVAREFEEAINKVETLRKQVQTIQNTIGARTRAQKAAAEKRKGNKDGDDNGEGDDDGTREVGMAPTSHMSLRELWMKKLESEAIMDLIKKLDVIRDAPGQFDFLVSQPSCKLGEAVLCLSDALDTMFSEDMRKVVALNKILEQLLLRKKTAEELIWETLRDVIFLRSGNGMVQKLLQPRKDDHQDAPGVEANGLEQGPAAAHLVKPEMCKRIYNPFQKNYSRFCVGELIDDDASVDSQDSGASLFSFGHSDDEEEEEEKDEKQLRKTRSHDSGISGESSEDDSYYDDDDNDDDTERGGAGAAAKNLIDDADRKRSLMLPQSMLEAPVNLIVDEMRCLDEKAGYRKTPINGRRLPRYSDAVLSSRIIVECLVKLGRLHEVEQVLLENVEKEIKELVQRIQNRTFQRLARRKPAQTIRTSVKEIDDLKEFRLHFTAVLSGFGCVMIRLSHLAQIIRYRIWADEELRVNFPLRALFLNEVLEKAYSIMQKELKDFLRACLQEHLSKAKAVETASAEKGKHEKGFFSFGIIPKKVVEEEEAEKPEETINLLDEPAIETMDVMDSSTFVDMPVEKFVSTVLFAMTNTTPQVQHALVFRRSMDRFTAKNAELKKQLFDVAGDANLTDMMMGNRGEEEELAIMFLDKAIQDTVLPSLQADAVRGTIIASEMQDAFEPLIEGHTNLEPMDVAMVQACEGMLEKTEPLFMAIHRLPPGGEMYKALVQVLQFLVETFNSMVEPKVSEVCEDTTADELLTGFGRDKGKLAAAFRRRGAFSALMEAYEFDLNLMTDLKKPGDDDEQSLVSDSDTEKQGKDAKKAKKGDDLPENEIQREEALMKQELIHLGDYMDFLPDNQESMDYDLITKSELRKAACLAHSFLKVASVFENRLKASGKGSKLLGGTASLFDAIGILKNAGIRMANYCRMEVLLQIVHKMSRVCMSTTLCAREAVRIPSAVNEVNEYLVSVVEYLREGTSNAMAAYCFSELGQYLPNCLMETVRVIAEGEGIIAKAPLTMNGIEALDRSAAILYRDLKTAMSFQSAYFNIQVAAISFERAATFTALMDMTLEELAEYYTTHPDDFSNSDFELLFGMDGPRKRGDSSQFKKLKKSLKKRRDDKLKELAEKEKAKEKEKDATEKKEGP